MILVLGKARNHRAPNLGCSGAESPGWFDVLPKTAQDMMHERARCCDEAANHQLPTAAAFWIIQFVSSEERSSSMQHLIQICWSTCSVCWMWQPHSTPAHSTGLPPPLTSRVKSPLSTHAHSSPLSLAARLYQCHANCSCYINSGWTFSGQTSYIYCKFYLIHRNFGSIKSLNSYL